MRLVVGASWMISPDIRQSFLLSSSTVFIFSIQTASTGPSNINHFLNIEKIIIFLTLIFKTSILLRLIKKGTENYNNKKYTIHYFYEELEEKKGVLVRVAVCTCTALYTKLSEFDF